VIVSRRGGLPEVIKDKKNGLLFTPGDIQDLARCIDSLGSLDKKSLCSAAKDTAAFFSPEKNLAAVLAVYKKLLT
jgi:glycosyltransferase involved in cell wall biosynthesis